MRAELHLARGADGAPGGPDRWPAFEPASVPPHVPDAVRRAALAGVRSLPFAWAGPAEFFLASMGRNLVAPTGGGRSLAAFFRERARPHDPAGDAS